MTQKTWFITGINSGFGRVIPELLLQRGDRIAGTARKSGQLDELTKRYSEQLWATSLDVTDDRPFAKPSTQHQGRLLLAQAVPGYEDTPARHPGTFLARGSYTPPGDSARMMQAVINSVDQSEAPKRLTLGSDAYTALHDVPAKRLDALEAQKDVAFSTDVEGGLYREGIHAH